MTNKQWLNTLSEEDFTNALYDYDDDIECKYCAAYYQDTDCHHRCREAFIVWLKQEYKDN